MSAAKSLTDRQLRTLAAPEKQTEISVGGVPGLMLRLSPGGTKAFTLVGRVNGRKFRKSLGRYPDVPLKAARDKARVLLCKAGSGEMDELFAVKKPQPISTMNDLVVHSSSAMPNPIRGIGKTQSHA